jgi:hypothetical protein
MKLFRTHSFKQDYKRLSQDLQRRADKQLELLLRDPRHPSLRTIKMEGKWGEQGVFEARVTRGHRCFFDRAVKFFLHLKGNVVIPIQRA